MLSVVVVDDLAMEEVRGFMGWFCQGYGDSEVYLERISAWLILLLLLFICYFMAEYTGFGVW